MRTTRQKFNLILTLALWLVAAQTAWAGTTIETRTMTWPMNGTGVSGSVLTNSAGNRVVLSNYSWKATSNATKILNGNNSLVGTEISFPDIEGKVTKVELKNFYLVQEGICLKAGKNNNILLCSSTFASYNDEDYTSYTDFTFEGSLDVTASAPLKLMIMTAPGKNAPEAQELKFKNGSLTVTYEVEVEVQDPEDPGHSFSFNASGNTLTATCNQLSQYHNCGLTNGKTTLILSVENSSYETFGYHPASINLSEFNQQTGLQATKGDIIYTNNTTGESTNKPTNITEGNYTASVTITIGSSNYTLTKNFSLLAGFKVNNSYSQLSVSPRTALEGDEVTITFTQQVGESLEVLTVTGATSGNNIAYTQSGNTYTFNMPAEDVNISATITYPLNENDFTQSGDTYTIKTAEGWNYFCRRMEVDGELNGFSGKTVKLDDDITVTTSMAGSGKYPFKGTFDGDGHTLTFNYTATAFYSAPFQKTNGTTIRNLHTTGSIQAGDFQNCGGLVGSAEGNLTIENCRVSIQISTTYSGSAWHGGFVGLLSSQYNQCHITGCVFDGLICNSNTWNQTYGCGGFVGAMSEYGYAILKDCLFIHGQYDNNNGKCELWWGNENNKNSTFVGYDMSNGGAKFTNCFYVGTRGLKQGSPAVESATAPTNFAHFGTPTDHRFLKVYGHTMVFGGKYYTPIYGDLVEEYGYNGVKYYNIEYDDAPLGIPDITSPLWTESLRYNRSFTAGKPVTIMLPFNFTRDRITLAHSSANPSGKFYEFKGIEEDLDHKWVAVMIEAGETLSNEVVENTLQANHPYLYVPGESTEYLDIYVGGTGISIFTEGNEGGTKETEYYYGDDIPWNHWMFKGTYQPRYWSETEHFDEVGKVYGFAGSTKEVQGVYNNTITVEAGEFVRAKVGAKIRPTSCYLMWTGYEPDYARALTRGAAADEELPQRITVKLVSASGDLTSIGEIDTTTGEVTFDGWYTLDGKPSAKGIYINNGKKIVIR